jgi:Ca2+/H+ antiporter
LIGLGTQLPIGELPFWSSHFWSGVLLIGLLLFSLAARSGIASTTQLRRLHVSAMVLGAVLFAVVGITGCRDLIQFTAGG